MKICDENTSLMAIGMELSGSLYCDICGLGNYIFGANDAYKSGWRAFEKGEEKGIMCPECSGNSSSTEMQSG